MKHNLKLPRWISAVIVGLALAGNTAWADFLIADFSSTNSFSDGGGVTHTITWDLATGNPPGSLYVSNNWANQNGWQDAKTQSDVDRAPVGSWPGIDCRQYVNLVFDARVDTANSLTNEYGDYGGIQLIASGWQGAGDNPAGIGWVQIGLVTLANTNNWQHFSVSLAAFPHYLNRLTLNFNANMWKNTTNAYHCAPVAAWVDNIAVTSPILPPPTLDPPKALTAQGLTLLPTALNDQFQRVMLYPAAATDVGWYDRPAPASYSFTLTAYPKVNHYAANAFLIPNACMGYGRGDGAVDWNCTNGLFFSIQGNTNNPATQWFVSLNAKTNLPAANANLPLVSFTYPNLPNGTWNLTFNQNTNITIAAPNGYKTNFSIPQAVADLVSGFAVGDTNTTAYIGIMPLELSNIGVPCVFGNLTITNGQVNLNDSFCPGGFDTSTWSQLGNRIFANCGDILGYLTWNTPNDEGFTSLLVAAGPNGFWADFNGPADWFPVGSQNGTLISKSALDAILGGAETNAAYFRMTKRVFSQLQILLPGETAAPGTLTGKTGTPDAQTVNSTFTFNVNGVDQSWHLLVSAADWVYPTSSGDTNTVIFNPLGARLAGGTQQFMVTITNAGTYSITINDADNPARASDTSTVIVNP